MTDSGTVNCEFAVSKMSTCSLSLFEYPIPGRIRRCVPALRLVSDLNREAGDVRPEGVACGTCEIELGAEPILRLRQIAEGVPGTSGDVEGVGDARRRLLTAGLLAASAGAECAACGEKQRQAT
jgi:hypothetical protein